MRRGSPASDCCCRLLVDSVLDDATRLSSAMVPVEGAAPACGGRSGIELAISGASTAPGGAVPRSKGRHGTQEAGRGLKRPARLAGLAWGAGQAKRSARVVLGVGFGWGRRSCRPQQHRGPQRRRGSAAAGGGGVRRRGGRAARRPARRCTPAGERRRGHPRPARAAECATAPRRRRERGPGRGAGGSRRCRPVNNHPPAPPVRPPAPPSPPARWWSW
jgi:hypothetical protein